MIFGVLFFILPLSEVFLLLVLDSVLEWTSILGISGITAVYGLWLMRAEDFSLWTLMESEIQNGRVPTEELLDAICIWGCGVCLLIPGILTDALGFIFILPVCRQTAVLWFKTRIHNRLNNTPS